MKAHKLLALGIVLIVLIATSCKEDGSTPDTVDLFLEEYDVYISGYVDNRAAYWKNGEITYLTDNITSSYTAESSSISASGSDVYIVGYTGDDRSPVYWKNGEANTISSLPLATVYSIKAYGSDVYVAFMDRMNQSNQNNAKLWKNGSLVPLNGLDPVNFSSCTDVEVSGSDVHAIGLESVDNLVRSKYWLNGEQVELITGSPNYSLFTDIAVEGNDVHIVGYQLDANNNSVYKHWKNGLETPLSSDIAPYLVAASGQDVFMVDSEAEYYAVNGEKFLLERGGDSGERYVAKELQIVDGNVFVTAKRFNASNQEVGGYIWMNGNLLSSLSIDMQESAFTGLALVKK